MATAVAVVKKTVTLLGEQPLIPLPKPPPTPLPPPNTLTHMIMIITKNPKHNRLSTINSRSPSQFLIFLFIYWLVCMSERIIESY